MAARAVSSRPGPRPAGGTGAPLLLGLGWDRPGGLNRYLQGLHRALAEQGVAARAVVLGPAAAPPTSVVVACDDDAGLARRLVAYARAARAVGAEIAGGPEAGTADGGGVVDVHFAFFAFWPVVVGSLRGRPLVAHFHGPWAEESRAGGHGSGPALWAKRRVERAVYRRASRIVVLSGAFKRVLVEGYRVEPWRVVVVPPGVDLERFTPGHAGARARLGLPLDIQVVFTARRLVPRTGLHLLVRAWSRLGGSDRRLLAIAGEGPERAALKAQVDRLGPAGSVRLLGRVGGDELVDWFRAADLSVVPSLSLEGFGLVVLESLASGTPVLATEVGGLPEILARLDPSLVVEPQPGALAERIASDGTVPSGAACRAYAEQFSWARTARRHAEVYADAAGAGRPDRGRPLRVVYLDHCALLSGAEIALLRLLASLEGVEPHVILGEDGPLLRRLLELGVSVEVLPLADAARGLHRHRVRPGGLPLLGAARAAGYTLGLARHLRRLGPDLVHTNSLKAALYGTAAARLAGVPVVWHARDRGAGDSLPVPAERLVRRAVRLSSGVIANSRTTLESLVPGAEDAGRPAAVIPDPYRPRRPLGARALEGLPLRVGMVGRLAPWKGQHVALCAFARAFPGGREQLVLVGSPMFGEQAYEAELRALVATLGLDGRVELAGFRHDVEAELARLDVLVHASVLAEPFGQAIVEGMAAGVPVVAAAAGGPAEIIDHDVNGLLYPPGDVDGLCAALRRLAAEPATRRRLGEAGRAAAQAFAPERVAPAVLALYRSVLASGRGSPTVDDDDAETDGAARRCGVS